MDGQRLPLLELLTEPKYPRESWGRVMGDGDCNYFLPQYIITEVTKLGINLICPPLIVQNSKSQLSPNLKVFISKANFIMQFASVCLSYHGAMRMKGDMECVWFS